MEQADSFSAFISYASPDREKAFEICRILEAKGMRCWIAPRNVRAGREYADEIVRGIERATKFILVFSDAANQSGFVRREVERAVSKNKSIFPVRIENVLPGAGLEFFVSSSHWVDAYGGDFNGQIEHLARDLADESGTDHRPLVHEAQRVTPPPPPSKPAAKPGFSFSLSGPNRHLVMGGIGALVIGLAIALFFATRQPTPEQLQDRATWQQAALADNLYGYQAYLRLYPDGRYSHDAQRRITDLQEHAAQLATRTEAQQVLAQLGYDPGRPGDSGDKFDAALKQFKRDHNMRMNGDMDPDILDQMRKIAEEEKPRLVAYSMALSQKTRMGYESYLTKYPDGRFTDDVKARLQSCRTTTVSTPQTANDSITAQGQGTGQGGYACQMAESNARASLAQECAGGRLAQVHVSAKANVANDMAANVAAGLVNSFLSGGRNVNNNNASSSCTAQATGVCQKSVMGSSQREVCS